MDRVHRPHESDDVSLTVRRIDGDPPLLVLDQRRLRPDATHAARLGLSPRQAEVVALAGRGLTNREIAAHLVVSVRTVEKHLQAAFEQLDVHTRTAAARRLFGDELAPPV